MKLQVKKVRKLCFLLDKNFTIIYSNINNEKKTYDRNFY